MSDTPTPADLARELIRLTEAVQQANDAWHASRLGSSREGRLACALTLAEAEFQKFVESEAFAHGRTIAEALLAAAVRAAELEAAIAEMRDNCGCYEDADQCANCYRADAVLAKGEAATP